MAAFSNQNQPPFLLHPPIKASTFTDEEHNIFPNCFSPQFSPDSTLLDHVPEFSPIPENTEPSSVFSTRKQSTDDSSNVVDKIENSENVTLKKRRRSKNVSFLNDLVKGKGKKQQKSEKKAKIDEKEDGYVHVRARRGQATDSHSLAERVRREKISERMKTLQQLVPGCDKLSGKAVMLDEIINYVQSLQHQVEFLSMRIASLSPFLYEYGMDFDDAFMFRPDEEQAAATLQQCSSSPTDTTTAFFPHNNYHLLDVSSSLLLQSQGNGNAIWDMEMSSFH